MHYTWPAGDAVRLAVDGLHQNRHPGDAGYVTHWDDPGYRPSVADGGGDGVADGDAAHCEPCLEPVAAATPTASGRGHSDVDRYHVQRKTRRKIAAAAFGDRRWKPDGGCRRSLQRSHDPGHGDGRDHGS
jgi:hypothetical protein